VPKVALNAQAAGLLAYLAVERLEPERADRRPAKDSVVVETARAALKAAAESASVTGIPDSVKRDVLADIANAQAMLFEYEARLQPDAERTPKALLAEKSYLRALEHKRDWLPVLSNLARIYQELLSRQKDAEQLWNKVLQIRPGDKYSHYMLGKLLESTDLPRAFGHYWIAGQSGDIPGAAKKLIELETKVPVRLLPKGYRTPSSPSPTPEGGSTH
jgi:hypothetical protein